MKFNYLNSRAITPKIHVPLGFLSWSITIIEFLSYYIIISLSHLSVFKYAQLQLWSLHIILEVNFKLLSFFLFFFFFFSFFSTIITLLISTYQQLLVFMIWIHINSQARYYLLHSNGFKNWSYSFLNTLFQWKRAKKNCLFKKKKKESCQFFPNKGLFLLVLCSYLKIMNCVCIGILGAATEIAFSGYIFCYPTHFINHSTWSPSPKSIWQYCQFHLKSKSSSCFINFDVIC